MYNTGWESDSDGGLILFRVPDKVKFAIEQSTCTSSQRRDSSCPPPPSSTPARLNSLPREIFLRIVEYLHPVDRVCLALTCKQLTWAILSIPRLTPSNWSPFNGGYGNWNPPESFSLILRLAHGWIPKDKLRYCWKCHTILPRDEEYVRTRMSCKGKPRWSVKTGISQETWDHLSTKARYKQLVKNWCHSTTDDSSVFFCTFCSQARPTYVPPHLPPLKSEVDSNKPTYPVYCPICLEKELTFVFRIPLAQRLHNAKKKTLKWLWKGTKFVLKGIALIFIYTAYVICESTAWLIQGVIDIKKCCSR